MWNIVYSCLFTDCFSDKEDDHNVECELIIGLITNNCKRNNTNRSSLCTLCNTVHNNKASKYLSCSTNSSKLSDIFLQLACYNQGIPLDFPDTICKNGSSNKGARTFRAKFKNWIIKIIETSKMFLSQFLCNNLILRV